jgi:hypothetical protein
LIGEEKREKRAGSGIEEGRREKARGQEKRSAERKEK